MVSVQRNRGFLMLKIVKQKMVVVLFLASILGAYRARAVELTPLIQAIVSHNKTKALELIKQYTLEEINEQDELGHNALIYAVSLCKDSGDVEIIKALLLKGAGIDTPGNSNFQPLHNAICFTPLPNRKEVVELLLARGANPNSTVCDELGTPFFCAVRQGNLDVLEALFAGKIKPDVTFKQKTDDGLLSCLSVAIVKENFSVVKWLGEHGADVAEQIELDGENYYLDEWAGIFQRQHEIAAYLRPLRCKQTNQKLFDAEQQVMLRELKIQLLEELENNSDFEAKLVELSLFMDGCNKGGCNKDEVLKLIKKYPSDQISELIVKLLREYGVDVTEKKEINEKQYFLGESTTFQEQFGMTVCREETNQSKGKLFGANQQKEVMKNNVVAAVVPFLTGLNISGGEKKILEK